MSRTPVVERAAWLPARTTRRVAACERGSGPVAAALQPTGCTTGRPGARFRPSRGRHLLKAAEPLVAAGRWPEVILWLTKARSIAAHDGVSRELYDIEYKLAELQQLTGDGEAAIRQSRAALATLRQLPDADAFTIAQHLGRLAQYHDAAGQREQRTEALREAVELMSDPRLARHLPAYLEALYDALRTQGAYRAAKAIAERAVALDTALGDDAHLVRDLNQLAIAEDWLGDLDAAGATHRRALEVAERAFGADHPEVGNVLNNLGVIAEERGDYLQATALYDRALEIFSRAFGQNAWTTAGALQTRQRSALNVRALIRACGSPYGCWQRPP